MSGVPRWHPPIDVQAARLGSCHLALHVIHSDCTARVHTHARNIVCQRTQNRVLYSELVVVA